MVVYFEKTAHFHRTTAVKPFPHNYLWGPGQPSELSALQETTALLCLHTVEIQRKPAACTEDQLPAAGLAMETLTIEGETTIKL